MGFLEGETCGQDVWGGMVVFVRNKYLNNFTMRGHEKYKLFVLLVDFFLFYPVCAINDNNTYSTINCSLKWNSCIDFRSMFDVPVSSPMVLSSLHDK